MKGLILLAILFSAIAFSAEIDGVPMSCAEKAEARMSKYNRMSLVSVCKDRKTPTKEHYTFCDGSGCTGFTAQSDNSCQFSDWWNGQDDQDPIDQDEWKESCLTSDDFKKPTPVNHETKLTTKRVNGSVVTGSSLFTFVGSTKGQNNLQLAEAVGKQIRREYYQQGYQVDGYAYEETSFKAAKKLLATSEGEFERLTEVEIEELDSWFENHQVKAVVVMSLTTNYQSGTGLEQNIIFIPTESYEPILAVKRFFYAE